MLKKLFTLSVIALLSAHALQAQAPFLVKDLNPGAGYSFSGAPSGINVTMDKIVIFTVKTESGLFQIMASDGTAAGTEALLPPYNPDSLTFSGFVIQDNLCWFLEYNSDAGSKLYATDGTTVGTTVRLSDPGQLLHLITFKSDLLFQKVPTTFDPQLLVRFNPADNSFFTVDSFDWFGGLRDFTVGANDTIYAIGGNSLGRSLYKGDGSPYSLEPITQLNSGSESNYYIYMTPVGNKVYFFWQKSDTNEPYKLWVTDGTAAGTKGLKEFEFPSFQSDPIASKALVSFGGKFYFRSKSPTDGKGYELYTSDGTAAGTKIVKDLNTGLADGNPERLTIFENKLWLSGLDNLYNTSLWQVSGNTATKQLTTYSAVGSGLAAFNDSLVMGVYSSTLGSEIIFSKGTAGSTRLVTDFNTPGNSNFYGYAFTPANGILYFIGAQEGSTGRELWAYRPAPPVATHAPINEIEVTIAPNPVQDYLFIAAPEAENMQVTDVTGKIMYSGKFDQQIKLNTASWPVGMYQVAVWGTKGRSVRGVVKM